MERRYAKKECVAMLLAGGQGSRLYVLTENVAKPAVPFGGKYRIIDFTLSNCVNSEIDTVGVLTQYQPLELNAYIGNGQPWDLDRLYGGVSILPPHIKGKTAEWYRGTANAIYQNLSFIDQYDPEYVLILSGDHIYTMNYAEMLAYHEKNNADCTIAVIEVPLAECSRFGIMNVNPDNSIYEFEEKPKLPKSNLASMGIYIFTYQKLREYLIADENKAGSKNDFGGDIIPAMLAAGERMMAYKFDGYWKDVGTIDSLWEAHMDLLGKQSGFDLLNSSWPIYARSSTDMPQYMGTDAHASHSMISGGCEIDGIIENSVIFTSVSVKSGARVSYSIIMPGAVIEEGAIVEYAIVAENAVIGRGAHIGAQPKNYNPENWGIAVVAANVNIGRDVVVKPKQMIDKDMLER